jgi:hypothetical protein
MPSNKALGFGQDDLLLQCLLIRQPYRHAHPLQPPDQTAREP